MVTNIDALQIVSEIRQLWETAEKQKQASDASMRDALVKTRQLSKTVCNGETSIGSSFADFVLVTYNSLEEKYVAKLNELEEKVKRHKGEMVLAVRSEPGKTFLSTEFDTVIAKFCLGVLKRDHLLVNVQDKRCDFLTGSRMVQKWTNTDAAVIECNLGFNSWTGISVMELDQPTDFEMRGHNFWYPRQEDMDLLLAKIPRMKLEIIIGDTAVEDWFHAHRENRTFEALKLALNL